MEALSGVSRDQPAMLIVYKDLTPNNKEKPIIQILFTYIKHVDHVKEWHRKIVVIEMLKSSHHFSFYAESADVVRLSSLLELLE